MLKEVDIVLLGTGLAPLVAANQLLHQGKSVLILNPDWDFFTENSELPLDPLWAGPDTTVSSKRLRRNLSDAVLEELRPDYPGPVEFGVLPADAQSTQKGYRDPHAPVVRARERLWIRTEGKPHDPSSDHLLSQIYVETVDAGLQATELEGLSATRRFPGYAGREPTAHWGIALQRLCEVDVNRYRTGVLEYIRHKLPADQLLCGVTQIEPRADELHFYSQGRMHSLKVREELIIFWTPKISPWIDRNFVAHLPSSVKAQELDEYSPLGVRVWEEWGLISREGLNPNTVAHFGDIIAWAEIEGYPSTAALSSLHYLRVLRRGPLIDPKLVHHPESGLGGLSVESFQSISDLCQGFLRWERFSIRSMQVRYIFEWRGKKSAPGVDKFWRKEIFGVPTRIVHGCDGPMTEVVHRARQSAGVNL